MSAIITAETVLSEAIRYADLNWHVLPVYGVTNGVCDCYKGGGCPSPGKHPIGDGWEKRASTEAETIGGWWEKNPNANVGVLLGPKSGIVDIEVDGPKAKEAAARFFDGIVTPTFSSGRGNHYLFRWDDDLPNENVLKCKVTGLEFRLGGKGGEQSVMPPSMHATGVRREWLLRPDDCDLAEIPPRVISMIANLAGGGDAFSETKNGNHPKKPATWMENVGGVPEGGRNAHLISVVGQFLSGKGGLLTENDEALARRFAHMSNESDCKPPLPRNEVDNVADSAIRMEKRNAPRGAEIGSQSATSLVAVLEKQARNLVSLGKRDVNALTKTAKTINDAQGVPLEEHDLQSLINQYVRAEQNRRDKRELNVTDWRLEIVESEPKKYWLYAPQFSRAPHGRLELNIAELDSYQKVALQAKEQAICHLHKKVLGRTWETLQQTLFERAVLIPAPPEEKRTAVLATLALRILERGDRIIGYSAGERTPSEKSIYLYEDGSVVFKFEALFERVVHSLAGSDRVTRPELSTVLRLAGMGRKDLAETTYKILDERAFVRLRRISLGDDLDAPVVEIPQAERWAKIAELVLQTICDKATHQREMDRPYQNALLALADGTVYIHGRGLLDPINKDRVFFGGKLSGDSLNEVLISVGVESRQFQGVTYQFLAAESIERLKRLLTV